VDSQAGSQQQSGGVFLVVRDDNPACLPLGARLEEVRRFERWEYPHCIPTIGALIVELKVLDGQRCREMIEEVFEQGYDNRPPWTDRPNWLVRASIDDRRVAR
jgi:hypothetical protein